LLGERDVLEMKNAVLAETLTLSELEIVVVEKDDPLQNKFSILVEFLRPRPIVLHIQIPPFRTYNS